MSAQGHAQPHEKVFIAEIMHRMGWKANTTVRRNEVAGNIPTLRRIPGIKKPFMDRDVFEAFMRGEIDAKGNPIDAAGNRIVEAAE